MGRGDHFSNNVQVRSGHLSELWQVSGEQNVSIDTLRNGILALAAQCLLEQKVYC
jgi:hypothetical protein